MFKIVAPYVILALAFAILNARLRLPPFSLFLVALTLTDGASPSPIAPPLIPHSAPLLLHNCTTAR